MFYFVCDDNENVMIEKCRELVFIYYDFKSYFFSVEGFDD